MKNVLLGFIIFSSLSVAAKTKENTKNRKPASTGDFICTSTFGTNNITSLEEWMNENCDKNKNFSVGHGQSRNSITSNVVCCFQK